MPALNDQLITSYLQTGNNHRGGNRRGCRSNIGSICDRWLCQVDVLQSHAFRSLNAYTWADTSMWEKYIFQKTFTYSLRSSEIYRRICSRQWENFTVGDVGRSYITGICYVSKSTSLDHANSNWLPLMNHWKNYDIPSQNNCNTNKFSLRNLAFLVSFLFEHRPRCATHNKSKLLNHN